MRYWEFALTESQAKKKIAVQQHTAKLAAVLANQKVPGHPEITTPAQLIDWLYSLDPTEAKLYFLWLVSRVTNNHDTLADIVHAPGVLERFQSALRTQHEMGVSSLNPSIETYQSLAALDSAVSALESSKDYADRAELVRARSESTILHEDSEWVVAIPQTQQAAKYWSRGTTQCINWGDPKGLFPDRTNMFHSYPGIYVIHNKHDPKRIFSIQFPERQFRDWEDKTIPQDQWDNTNPFIRKVVDYHGKKLLADPGTSFNVLIDFAKNCKGSRWPEAEPKIIELGDVREIITYARETIQGRWHEAESKIIELSDVREIITYAKGVIKDRWPEAEPKIIKYGNIRLILEYAAECIKGRWPDPARARVENMIIESDLTDQIVFYAEYCIKDRWPAAEPKIIEYGSIEEIVDYSKKIIDDEFPEFESKIIEHGSISTIVAYAKEFKEDGWPEVETKIIEHGGTVSIVSYAKKFKKDGWPEAEAKIIECGDPLALVKYASEIIKGRWPEPDRARVENMIIKRGNTQSIIEYAAKCIRGRWPEPDRARVENMITERGNVPEIVTYAAAFIRGRWPEPDRAQVENMIIESGNVRRIIIYVEHCIQGRWPEAEHVIFSQGTRLDQNQYRKLVQSSQEDGA